MKLSPKAKININLVAFGLLAVGLIYGMATQVLTSLESRYSVFATFPDAGGVFTNQEVTYRGLTVGQVGEMKVVPEGVSIELLINDEFEIPEEGIEARVMFKSAVGEQFVDLLPASDDAPFLEDGDEIPLAQTSIPVSTQELLSAVEAVLRGVPPRALEGAVDALGEGLTGRGSDLARIFESAAVLAELFADAAPEIHGILTEGTKLGDEFIKSRRDFVEAIETLVTVSATLSGSTEDLRRLLEGTKLSSEEIDALLDEFRPALEEVITELGEVNALQADHSDDLIRLFENLPLALNAVSSTFEPDTGMIRFGLIQESGRHACSYGTDRRRPEDRGNRPIPKNASCDTVGAPQDEAPASSSDERRGRRVSPTVFDTFESVSQSFENAPLPGRMADWSWTLFYLNVM
ncbi:MAG TPA: MCE family protein [Actinomycetota bacterium]|nr:MCE family protein [Actinomycetota bacterium]